MSIVTFWKIAVLTEIPVVNITQSNFMILLTAVYMKYLVDLSI